MGPTMDSYPYHFLTPLCQYMGFQAVVLAGATFSWIIACVGKRVGLCNTSPSPFPPASSPRWHFRGMPRKGSPRGTVKKQHNPEQP